jgi:hypothetical protein
MAISMYQAAVPVLLRAMNNLVAILEKGAVHAESHGIDASVLLQSRLFPDMFPLVRQVQIVSDISRRGVARLAGEEAPAMEDFETSFAELISRLQNSIAYLEGFEAARLDGTEEKQVTVPIGGEKSITMSGWPFLSCFVLPNVYFHLSTAYAILRHNGVPLGKLDFLGTP